MGADDSKFNLNWQFFIFEESQLPCFTQVPYRKKGGLRTVIIFYPHAPVHKLKRLSVYDGLH